MTGRRDLYDEHGNADPVGWGLATGRLHPMEAEVIRELQGYERRRVMASGGDPTWPTAVTEFVESLEPSRLAGMVRAAAGMGPAYGGGPATSGTPLLDATERELYGPTAEQRRRRKTSPPRRSLRQQMEDESNRVAASQALTDDEYRALFGPDG